jgi:hypothetical protein
MNEVKLPFNARLAFSSCPNLAMYISRIRDKRVKASLALKGSFTSFMGWFYIIFYKGREKRAIN